MTGHGKCRAQHCAPGASYLSRTGSYPSDASSLDDCAHAQGRSALQSLGPLRSPRFPAWTGKRSWLGCLRVGRMRMTGQTLRDQGRHRRKTTSPLKKFGLHQWDTKGLVVRRPSSVVRRPQETQHPGPLSDLRHPAPSTHDRAGAMVMPSPPGDSGSRFCSAHRNSPILRALPDLLTSVAAQPQRGSDLCDELACHQLAPGSTLTTRLRHRG